MHCPVDNEPLIVADRSGVEIDYCPKCRGVWLDRGELEKLIDRESEVMAGRSHVVLPQDSTVPLRRTGTGHPRARESFLADIFDF